MNTWCIQDGSVALESSHSTSDILCSQLAWGGNLYSSDLCIEELVLLFWGWHQVIAVWVLSCRRKKFVGRNKFMDIFEMLCPKAPTSTCRVKDIAFLQCRWNRLHRAYYKKFYTPEMSQTFTTFLPSSEFWKYWAIQLHCCLLWVQCLWWLEVQNLFICNACKTTE